MGSRTDSLLHPKTLVEGYELRTVTKCAPDGSVISTAQVDVTWFQVRAKRDQELEDSDWRALKDVTLPNPWKEYRQALRDLPQNHVVASDAADNWPEAPE